MRGKWDLFNAKEHNAFFLNKSIHECHQRNRFKHIEVFAATVGMMVDSGLHGKETVLTGRMIHRANDDLEFFVIDCAKDKAVGMFMFSDYFSVDKGYHDNKWLFYEYLQEVKRGILFYRGIRIVKYKESVRKKVSK